MKGESKMKRYSHSPTIGMWHCSKGEWVKYEDHKQKLLKTRLFQHIDKMTVEAVEGIVIPDYENRINELEAENRKLKTTTITGKDGVLKVVDVTDCTCMEGIQGDWERWSCPKHGYKKR